MLHALNFLGNFLVRTHVSHPTHMCLTQHTCLSPNTCVCSHTHMLQILLKACLRNTHVCPHTHMPRIPLKAFNSKKKSCMRACGNTQRREGRRRGPATHTCFQYRSNRSMSLKRPACEHESSTPHSSLLLLLLVWGVSKRACSTHTCVSPHTHAFNSDQRFSISLKRA